jgi:hypothetical protein
MGFSRTLDARIILVVHALAPSGSLWFEVGGIFEARRLAAAQQRAATDVRRRTRLSFIVRPPVTLKEAIAASSDRNLNFADIQSLVASYSGSPVEVLDAIALELARQYAARHVGFTAAEALANSMFAFATQHACLGDTLHRVFLAFDAGEFVPSTDADRTDPESAYTRPQIARIIVSVGRSNTSLERTRER